MGWLEEVFLTLLTTKIQPFQFRLIFPKSFDQRYILHAFILGILGIQLSGDHNHHHHHAMGTHRGNPLKLCSSKPMQTRHRCLSRYFSAAKGYTSIWFEDCPATFDYQRVNNSVTLRLCQNSYWKWPFVVDFSIKHGDLPWFLVCLPEGMWVFERLLWSIPPWITHTNLSPTCRHCSIGTYGWTLKPTDIEVISRKRNETWGVS